MLLEFRVENYRCFAEEAVLRLTAAADRSHPENVRAVPGVAGLKALKTAFVYGPNGSGKSTLIRAMETMRDFVRDSATRFSVDEPLPVDPFRLDPVLRKRPSSFEMTFVHEKVRYQYGFSAKKEKIVEEWLYAFPRGRRQTWFERKPGAKGWYFGPSLEGEKEQIRRLTRPNALYLSTAAHLSHPQLTRVYSWFSSIRIPGPKAWRRNSGALLRSVERLVGVQPEAKQHIIRLLRAADVGIEDFEIERIPRLPNERPQFRVRTLHRAKGEPQWFDLREDESLGTQELFYISLPWLFAMSSGVPLLVDEALSALHPSLVQFLVQTFLASKSGQLVMATHETSLLDSKLVRRDQVYFVEKDADGGSHLYSLLEFKPRKDEAFARGYLSGRYGAVPFLGSFDFE